MAKRKIDWDEDKLKKWIQEGRGQGEGKDYKPWLTVQDFPSKGRVSRVFGWKTKRIHHFFTDSETRYFYLLEWEDDVLDIREHYPLFHCEEVIQNKAGLNFDLFKDKDTGTPYILSTSFLITLLRKWDSTLKCFEHTCEGLLIDNLIYKPLKRLKLPYTSVIVYTCIIIPNI